MDLKVFSIEAPNLYCLVPCFQPFSFPNIIFFAGTCPVNEECIAITQCPFTKHLNMLMKFSSNKDDKKIIQQLITSKVCEGPSEESVCCDLTKGKSSLLH